MTTPEIPNDAQDQVRKAVDKALKSPGQAQGFLSNIPDLSAAGGVKDKVVDAIDKVVGAIDLVMQYAWIIPDQYEKPLTSFADALKKVKGWLG